MKIGVICLVCGVVFIVLAIVLYYVFYSVILQWMTYRLFGSENNDEFSDEGEVYENDYK